MEEVAKRDNRADLGRDPAFLSRDGCNIWSSSAEVKPQQMEDANYLMKHSSFQTSHSLITSRITEAHQRPRGQIKGMQALRTP